MVVGEMVGTRRIEIHNADGEAISIGVVGRMHPEAEDYWDGNWLVTPVEVKVSGFTAVVPAGLRAEELARFRRELEVLYTSLRGEAVLESMEGWVQLRITADSRGRICARGAVVDRPGSSNRLQFQMDGLDQTDLPQVVAGLRAVEASFPVRGRPDE